MTHERDGPMLWAGAMLVIGGGVGATVGLLVSGGIGIALGGAFGAGIGLVVGASIDSYRQRGR